MTGVWWDKHGVTNNSYTGSNFNTYPYFTTLAKQLKPDLYCAEVCEWPPLIDDVYNDNFNIRLHVPDGQGATTASTAAAVLANDSIDFMFTYFDQVDLTGHSSGFSPTNPAYITAIENVDSCVGVVLNALHNRTNYANEDWLILVMTDHGGTGTGHGGNTDQERHIWWMATGDNLQHVTPSGTDPGTYNPLIVGVYTASNVNDSIKKQTPVHPDIAVTALHDLIYDLNINPVNQPGWNLDGKSWLIDNTVNAVKPVEEPIQVKMFPNPTNNALVTVYFTNNSKQPVSSTLFDAQGNRVNFTQREITANKMSFDVTGLAAGMYTLQLTIGTTPVTRSLVIQ